ncbi:MAG: YARHG domain-containing protein [Proteobacteria bacterium]|nr:YARHG domain-containing protein [Pseudomonadota bacterium]MCP4921671.1 YARHG domain-containing protein [Pseudomonadota bacterium]
MLLLFALACGSEPAADVSTPAPPPPKAAEAGPAVYDGLFVDDPKLTPAQVAVMDPEKLPLIRNEIFARHGRAFSTDAIKSHFEAQPWYAADEAYTDAVLSANDKANAELIKSMEGASNPLPNGEYMGETPMMFMDGTTVTMGYGFGVYEHLNEVHNYSMRGDYAVTWTGSAAFDPSSKECTEASLWKLDHDSATVTHVARLPTG